MQIQLGAGIGKGGIHRNGVVAAAAGDRVGTALAVSSGPCLQSDGIRSVAAVDGCFQSATVVVETQAVVAGAAGDGCRVLSAVGGQVDGVVAFAAVHLNR